MIYLFKILEALKTSKNKVIKEISQFILILRISMNAHG